MTLNEITKQLFNLSIGGYFNREKFTETRLRNYITAMTRGENLRPVVMEIALPDGWWNFEIHRLPEIGKDFYDYSIPENREQEKAVLGRLAAAQKGVMA